MAMNGQKKRLKKIRQRFEEANEKFIKDLAEQIAAIRDAEAADYITLLALLNGHIADIDDSIDAAVRDTEPEMRAIYREAMNGTYNNTRFKRALKDSQLSKDAERAIAQNVLDVERDTARRIRRLAKANTVSQTYQQAVNKAVLARNSGLGNYDGIMRPTVRALGRNGIVATGDDGKKYRITDAILRAVRDGVQEVEQYTDDVLTRELGFEAVEISVHDNPAPDHEPIQGRVFTREEFENLQNHLPCNDIDGRHYTVQVRAIGELNCRHIAHGFSLEYGQRQYTPEQLDEMAVRNAEGCKIDGKYYSLYDAGQLEKKLMAEQKQLGNILIAARTTNDVALELECKRRIAEIKTQLKLTSKAKSDRISTIDIQLFGERDLTRQSIFQLEKGIVSLRDRVELHKHKIANPAEFVDGWHDMPVGHRVGIIRHWRKEIDTFEKSIQNRIDELERRGIRNE